MPWQSDTNCVFSNETQEECFGEWFQSCLKTMAWLSNVDLRGETHMKGQNVSAGNNRRLPSLKLCLNPWCHIIQLYKYSTVIPWWMALSFIATTCLRLHQPWVVEWGFRWVQPDLESMNILHQISREHLKKYTQKTKNETKQKTNKTKHTMQFGGWRKHFCHSRRSLLHLPTTFLHPNKEAGLET